MDVDVRPLTYFIEDGKVMVKTNCSKCQREWVRREYGYTPPNILILLMCPECSKFDEKVTIIANNHSW